MKDEQNAGLFEQLLLPYSLKILVAVASLSKQKTCAPAKGASQNDFPDISLLHNCEYSFISVKSIVE